MQFETDKKTYQDGKNYHGLARRIHEIIMEKLRTNGTLLGSSNETKPIIQDTVFDRFDGQSNVAVRSNFGVNWQDATVFLSSKALKYFTIALEKK